MCTSPKLTTNISPATISWAMAMAMAMAMALSGGYSPH